VGEILLEPAFSTTELAILQSRERANLAHEAQDTREQAMIALTRLLYKKGHPNRAESTEESRRALKKITKQKLEAFHKKILGRKTLVLSVAGDAAPARVFSPAQRYFSELPDHGYAHTPPPKPPLPKPAYQKVFVPHKANIDYYVGLAAGITSDHPDYVALMLGVSVLGIPGFTGRMMKTIREREGLTYVVYAYMSGFERVVDGAITMWGTFAPQLFARGREAIAREVRKVVDEGVSEEEAKKFRELIFNKTRVQMSNSMAFAKAAHAVAAEGRPLAYLDEFPQRVLKTTRLAINRALKKYLNPAKLAEAAAGPV